MKPIGRPPATQPHDPVKTRAMVLAYREAKTAGKGYDAVGEMFGVSGQAVQQVYARWSAWVDTGGGAGDGGAAP